MDNGSHDVFDFAATESETAGSRVVIKTYLCPSDPVSLDGDGMGDLATYQPDTTAIGPGESFTYTLDPREVGVGGEDWSVIVVTDHGQPSKNGTDYSGSHALYQDIYIPTAAPAMLEKFLADEPGRQSVDDGLWLV